MTTLSKDDVAVAEIGAEARVEDDDDDDYMNMSFDDPIPSKETSFQRTKRLKQEARERGFVKSKAEQAKEEEAVRQKAISTSLLDDPKAKKSKGLAMMSKMGFTGGGLGKKDEEGKTQGRAEPINVHVKEDRGGIGLDNQRKRQLEEAAQEMGVPIKTAKLDPDAYRERMRKEREDSRIEAQLVAAQRLAERLDDEAGEYQAWFTKKEDEEGNGVRSKDKDTKRTISSRPLKSIPVLYRGLVRHREEEERDRTMRHALEQSLPRLPTYDDDDDDDDDDNKAAFNRGKVVYATAEDLDEEDEELDRFNEFELGERLRRLLLYLRSEHKYCFWCKMAYPDDSMEGCPGLTEEEHD